MPGGSRLKWGKVTTRCCRCPCHNGLPACVGKKLLQQCLLSLMRNAYPAHLFNCFENKTSTKSLPTPHHYLQTNIHCLKVHSPLNPSKNDLSMHGMTISTASQNGQLSKVRPTTCGERQMSLAPGTSPVVIFPSAHQIALIETYSEGSINLMNGSGI